MSRVNIQNLFKSYGPVEVLNDINLEIEEGEFVVLVGPSGCGKSTLLRSIAGLESINSGTIEIGEQVVNEVSPQKRDIAMVFQNYALYPQMTVRRNMSFGLRIRGRPKAEIDLEVEKAADILGLESLLDRYPRQLSGGQRQRVAIGRAIVRHPRAFLFDEPLSNLDAKLRVQMRKEIKELHQKLGTTFIYVTHDQIEAMTMADRIVVLHDGIIEQAGDPVDLYDDPDNLFVAGFIGSPAINQLEARAVRDDAGLRLKLGSGQIVEAPAGISLDEGQEVVVGIRPEHRRIVADPSGDAEVSVVEPTGSETITFVRWMSEEFCAASPGRAGADHGDKARLEMTPEHILLFDQASGKRIR